MRAVVVVVVLGLVACSTKPNPNRCCTDTADCEAAGISEVTPCGDNLVCRGHQCIAETCSSSSQCDLSAPFCVDMSCSAMCTADDQCPGNGGDSGNVHCVDGACVACRAAVSDCPTSAPVCDMGACRGCAIDAECPSAVCNTDDGTCVDETLLVYASPSGSASAPCSKAAPCSLTHAFSVADASRPNIKVESGTYSTGGAFGGTFALTVYGPATVGSMTISSAGGQLRLRNLDIQGVVTCQPTASNVAVPTVDLENVSITSDTSTTGNPFDSAQCKAVLDGVTVTTVGQGAGLIFEGYGGAGSSIATANRLHVIAGDPGIMLTNQSTLAVTNSIFEGQGTTNGAITLSTGGTGGESGTISFSTFYNSLLKCPTGNAILASQNNVFLNEASGAPTNTVSGTSCTHSYDMIKPQSTSPGSTNLLNMDPRFVNAATGDFHLMAGSPAIDASDPAATLSTDYDGTTRPQGAGRDLGAFEYKP